MVQIVLDLNYFSWLPCGFDISSLVLFLLFDFVVCFKTVLLSGTIRWSSLILYISCSSLETGTFPRSSSLYWRTLLEIKICMLSLIITTRVLLLVLGSLCWQSKKICVCVQMYMYKYVCKHLYLPLSKFANHDIILISPTLYQYHMEYSILPPLLVCNASIPRVRNLTPTICHSFTCLIPVYMCSSLRIINLYPLMKQLYQSMVFMYTSFCLHSFSKLLRPEYFLPTIFSEVFSLIYSVFR